MIDAMEGQDVATADIAGALLQNDYDKGDKHINMEVGILTLLEEIDPAYCKKLIYIYSHGGKCMYAEPKKAVYGTLEESLIFLKNFPIS